MLVRRAQLHRIDRLEDAPGRAGENGVPTPRTSAQVIRSAASVSNYEGIRMVLELSDLGRSDDELKE